jgi:uncharacterized repeat protein (TIGR03803 family)
MKKKLLTLVAVNSLLIAVSFPMKAQYDTIHNFNGTAGGTPEYGSLINVSGVLYGMAETGGAHNFGCIFSINPDGTGYTDLLDFDGTSAPKGETPMGSLVYSPATNKIYGMTEIGGLNNDGCIFSVHPNGTGYTDVWDFQGGGLINGANPYGSLTLAGKKLYGMTEDGGLNSEGNVFSIDTGGGAYKDVFDMNSFTSGQFPYGNLTLSVTGDTLFGMTSQSGPSSGDGVLFSIDTSGSAFTDMLNFTGTNGDYPSGSLVLGGNVLYGMTSAGGSFSKGNIFSITTDGGYTNLYSFPNSGANGKAPYGSLILSGKVLYGMTSGGGVNLDGNIFKMDTTGTGFVDMVDLDGTTTPGSTPYGSLMLVGNALYGMTSFGGTDNKGVIFKEPLISVSTTDTGVSCNGNSDGHATANISGGTAPYTYSWAASGGTNRTATGLSAGSYTISITDNAGLTASNTVVITQPAVLGATTGFTQASCNLSNGSATATVTGGTSPYTYLWNDASSQTTATANNLSAGTYDVGVADMNGCTTSATVTVTQPSVVSASISGQTNVTCNGGSNGTASSSVSGGSAPYTYDWSAGNASTSGVSSLGAGIYSLTVTDNNGCSSSTTVTITEPNSLTAGAAETANVSCNGGNNGSAMANPSGGTSPYTYQWNDGNSQSTAAATGLTVGSYTVTITDACSGSATASVGVSQPPNLGASANATTNVYCIGGNNGSATATPTGGTSPYTYLWSSGSQTTPTATGLSTGAYTVIIHDNCGTSFTANVTITQPNPIGVSATAAANVSCHGGSNGIASSTVTGGTAPFTYSWTGGGGNASSASDLGVGTYTLTVNDACGDGPLTTSVIITQPATDLTIISTTSTLDTGTNCVATASVSVSGGTPPYNYAWTSGSTVDSVYNQCSGSTDTCYVTDANGCITSVFITFQGLGIDNITNRYSVNVYPDPNKGVFTISINGQAGSKNIEIYNALGQKVYSQLSTFNAPLSIDLSGQPNGIYLIRIENTDGTLVTEKKMIKTE